jgi:hypothetical protein
MTQNTEVAVSTPDGVLYDTRINSATLTAETRSTMADAALLHKLMGYEDPTPQ